MRLYFTDGRIKAKNESEESKIKVLMLNGSPRLNGNTLIALKEMEQVFKAEGIEAEIVQPLMS